MSNLMTQIPGEVERIITPIIIDALHPDWQSQARCLGVGSQYFFGKEDLDSKNMMNISDVRRAARLCDVCPVFRECITHAILNREEYGIWAGSTGKVRKQIRAMISRGEVTPQEVIEDYCHGRTTRYRAPAEAPRSRRPRVGGLPVTATGLVTCGHREEGEARVQLYG
jgi:hypothetical protein